MIDAAVALNSLMREESLPDVGPHPQLRRPVNASLTASLEFARIAIRARVVAEVSLCRLSPQKPATTMEEKKPRRLGVGGTGIPHPRARGFRAYGKAKGS